MKIDEIFAKCTKLTMSKRHDYTTNAESDNHENFKRSALIAEWFKSNDDKSYVILIGTKLARLGSLLSTAKEPKNESIEDSFLDLINYCALWMERRTTNLLTNCAYCNLVLNNPDVTLTRIYENKTINFCSYVHLEIYFHGKSNLNESKSSSD